MNFYIVDDDPSIPMILRQILEKNPDNTVVGIAHDAKKALADIMLMDVDIVLADLLMPGISGIELVKKLKALKPALRAIMISQVKDSDLRAEAYEAGIEFFIDKPINVIEVKTVVEKVAQSVQMATKLNNIQSLVGGGAVATAPVVDQKQQQKEKILSILRFLGITSEAGSSDILAVAQIMLDQNLSFREIDFNAAYHIDDREKKIMFQRIRRAIKTGLTNLANISLDGMGDEIVVEYANTLYEYKNVRSEMLLLEGTRTTGGKTSLKRFFDGLVQEV
ncbi:MAG: response regulator [Levilactobacillus sp.]|jgi:two-component system response regulator YcbB|uniref:Response regulator n=1 Tax=Levilactobacillus suantsaiihabitans TaxID=2487722 RepID=A0A4Z0JF16_9LACO|nr:MULTISPECIES: DNA-binding domain-containing protein [Levilactobacillus]MCI1553131.1 response regulator [Levilactobacillus sp.]MCI1598786.1 response regulator [Levilactobacillus sp.]MCI1605172.1 response regulator [Levilactobacillus sp.]TGD20424.1 response regulator [Levilactobacillus suantsaiihabitans]